MRCEGFKPVVADRTHDDSGSVQRRIATPPIVRGSIATFAFRRFPHASPALISEVGKHQALRRVALNSMSIVSPYVFPSDVGDGHFTAAKSCLSRLCAMAKIEGVTPHTLRHTFGSVAGDLGFSELTIAALLGHAARGVTQGYVYIGEALKLAAARTCEEIALLLSGSSREAMKAKNSAA